MPRIRARLRPEKDRVVEKEKEKEKEKAADMCFSWRMSLTFAAAGAAATVYAALDRRLRAEYMPVLLAFYTAMEALQTVQYMLVNECSDPRNRWLTEVAYALVVVQPLLWNVVFYLRMSGMSKSGRSSTSSSSSSSSKRVFLCAAAMCVLWILMSVFSRLTYAGEDKDALCSFFHRGETPCTMQDDGGHLYWSWPSRHYRDMNASFFMYLVLWFVPALFVAQTRPTGVVLMIGAALSLAVTVLMGKGNLIEFPSTWCLASVPILGACILLTLTGRPL